MEAFLCVSGLFTKREALTWDGVGGRGGNRTCSIVKRTGQIVKYSPDRTDRQKLIDFFFLSLPSSHGSLRIHVHHFSSPKVRSHHLALRRRPIFGHRATISEKNTHTFVASRLGSPLFQPSWVPFSSCHGRARFCALVSSLFTSFHKVEWIHGRLCLFAGSSSLFCLLMTRIALALRIWPFLRPFYHGIMLRSWVTWCERAFNFQGMLRPLVFHFHPRSSVYFTKSQVRNGS